MSVYRRGAIYWWCRSVRFDAADPRPRILRISLKTSDKAEARSRALDMELKMVALRLPPRDPGHSPAQWGAVYKEALEVKRDDIKRLQSRPPFDDTENLQFNTALAHIFALSAETAAAPFSDAQWDRLLDRGSLELDDRILMEEIAEGFGLRPAADRAIATPPSLDPRDAPGPDRPYTKPPIAPNRVVNALQNAGIPQTRDNVRIALAVVSGAYAEAFLEANIAIRREPWEVSREHLPSGLKALLPEVAAECTTAMPVPEASSHPAPDMRQEERPATVVQVRGQTPLAVSNTPHPALTDLTISEVVEQITTAKLSSQEWKESAERNARVIADIFIAVNGDLTMSAVKQQHILAVIAHLDIMPAVWGKSREDKVGGFPAIFARGRALAAQWNADPKKAIEKKLCKVGFTIPTFNRHIFTLRQLLSFTGTLRDAEGQMTYTIANIDFRHLKRKDRRKKNKLKPVPTRAEVDRLLGSPLHLGCAGIGDRFTPGSLVIHDSGYWMPLILVVYGPRSNEFCQLPLRHVIDDAPIPYFRIEEWELQDVKTSTTNRDLPIAPRLIELGFLDYVRALRNRGEWWLFPELNTTNEKPRKVFMDDVFGPLRDHAFPNGTSAKKRGKDIDTQSLRKFLATFLSDSEPKIDLRLRQFFFGHQRTTTIEEIYQSDPPVEKLMPCVEWTQQLIAHLPRQPLRLRECRLCAPISAVPRVARFGWKLPLE